MRDNTEWFENGSFQTYLFCHYVQDTVEHPFSYISNLLQDLLVEDGIIDFVQPWQKDSALHKFSKFIINSQFESECSGNFLTELFPNEHPKRWALPVDAALNRYDLVDPGTYFAEPSKDLTSTEQQDAYYDYWLDLRESDPYKTLLDRLSEEVFTVLFSNRTVLEALNRFLASHISFSELDDKMLQNYGFPVKNVFSAPGVLKRRSPPEWVKRTVFFRDNGLCTECGYDLNPASTRNRTAHYDHIVPLAQGGLNDITNMQLLCGPDNLKKGMKEVATSRYYERWYRK